MSLDTFTFSLLDPRDKQQRKHEAQPGHGNLHPEDQPPMGKGHHQAADAWSYPSPSTPSIRNVREVYLPIAGPVTVPAMKNPTAVPLTFYHPVSPITPKQKK
jgi:hypothetical protein